MSVHYDLVGEDSGSCLGRGAFGKVFIAVTKATGEVVAVKKQLLTLSEGKAELLALKILQANHSDHIVQLLDHWGCDGHLYLAMELMCTSLWDDFKYRCWTNRPVPVR